VAVDVGAGTGQFTLAVAPVVARVVAVDVSAVLLERLRTKVAVSGLSNVEVVHAGFLTYEHTGEAADVVYDFPRRMPRRSWRPGAPPAATGWMGSESARSTRSTCGMSTRGASTRRSRGCSSR
jgi:hypothetical protein